MSNGRIRIRANRWLHDLASVTSTRLAVSIMICILTTNVIARAGEDVRDKEILGWIETALVTSERIKVKAKLDTGAKTTSLHAINIKRFKRDGRRMVRFTIEDPETGELLEMAAEEDDDDTLSSIGKDVGGVARDVEGLEFRRMFSGEMDDRPCYLDIQAGSGGTEAQDWAEMLLRMYLRWGERHGFKTELIEVSPGEVAGIKSATVKVEGDYAFGWLRTETGVHRLVRKSPFD